MQTCASRRRERGGEGGKGKSVAEQEQEKERVKKVELYIWWNFCIEFEKCHSKNAIPGSFSAPGKLESFTI